MSKALVVGAGLMGAAVVAAAGFTIIVFAGLFTVSSGVGGHGAVTLVQQPPSTITPPSSPSDATDPPSPSDTTAPVSPSTAASTRRSPLPSSNRVATPRTTGGASSCAAAVELERFGATVLGLVVPSERRASPGDADNIGTGHEQSGARASRTQQVGRSRVSRVEHDR